MGRALQFPGTGELPKGDRRDFAEELFGYYRSARRPRLVDIEQRIQDDDELEGCASHETIRKMLTGKTVPLNWNNVYAVFTTLCAMAGVSVEDERFPEDNWETTTLAAYMEALWNRAIDAPPVNRNPVPIPPAPGFGLDDPPF